MNPLDAVEELDRVYWTRREIASALETLRVNDLAPEDRDAMRLILKCYEDDDR